MTDAAYRSRFAQEFDRLDVPITTSLARVGVHVLRIGLGFVFLWFGALKLFPDLSPARDLAPRTISLADPGSGATVRGGRLTAEPFGQRDD
jgi:hypothetical protein